MIPRLYFDSSVFGGIYDKEFKTESDQIFGMVRSGEIICEYSDLSEFELENAPFQVKEHFLSLPKQFLNLLKYMKK